MAFKLGQRSEERLKGVHPDLVKVVRRALEISKVDFAVFGGANFGVLPYAGNPQQRYDPNPVFWNAVDDTQDTVWTDIVAV